MILYVTKIISLILNYLKKFLLETISYFSNLGPIFETTLDDNNEAKSPDFLSDNPLVIPYKKAPANVSPAPTVSTAFVG